MSAIYTFIKLYPFFGYSMTVVCVDLLLSSKRKGSKKGMALSVIFGILFFMTATLWVVMRGDKNANDWFFAFNRFITGK